MLQSLLWSLLVVSVAQLEDVAMRPRAAFVHVDGERVHYVDWGGSGEPLILVPGRCDSPFVFGDLAPLLVTRYRVMGVTARGCGESGGAPDGYGIDRQIRELVGFLDALAIDRATFAGHSAGGGKVIRLAQLHPARVSRLVTFDVIYQGVPDAFESTFSAALALPTAPVSLASFRREFEAWELGTWSTALEQDFHARTERAPDQWHRVRRLPPQAQRQLDPMVGQIARARQDQLAAYQTNGRHVRVVPLDGASHYLFIDRARDVADEMLQWLGLPPR